MPKVSILLPAYNGSKFISKAIESVLAQSFLDWELLIIDDGSTDNTAKIANDFSLEDRRIKYLKNENNLGLQKTLNEGILKSEGIYIARIDDDDEWIDADKLKNQVEFLDNNREFSLVGTAMVATDENGKKLYDLKCPASDDKIRRRLLSQNCFAHSSVLFRRDLALKLGGYSENKETRHIEDHDFWLRLGMNGKLANLPFYGIKCRIRQGSVSGKNIKEQQLKAIKLAKKYKNSYPNYFQALTFAYLRLAFRIIFGSSPFRPAIKRFINKFL